MRTGHGIVFAAAGGRTDPRRRGCRPAGRSRLRPLDQERPHRRRHRQPVVSSATSAIKQGRIVAVGQAGRAHRHPDASTPAGWSWRPGSSTSTTTRTARLLVDGDAHSMVHQGVTSVILGEGGSAAPSQQFPDLPRLLRASCSAGGISINVGSLRRLVADLDRGARRARPARPPAELETHAGAGPPGDGRTARWAWPARCPGRPAPGSTPTRWWRCARRRRRCGGIYSTHMRHEGRRTCSRRSTRRSRSAAAPRCRWTSSTSRSPSTRCGGRCPSWSSQIAAARAEGADVQANVYPYRAGQNDLATIIPPWAHEGGSDGADRAPEGSGPAPAHPEGDRRAGIPGWYNHYTATGSWEGMLLVSLSQPELQALRGQAHERGDRRPRRQAVRRVLPAADRQRRLGADRLLPPRREGHAVRAAASRSSRSARTAAR